MPGMTRYSHSFQMPANRDAVFALFAEPRYLDLLTPPWFRLDPLEPLPARLGRGVEISYRLQWRGLTFRWTSLLTDWQAPESITYEQKQGPYRFFRHEHIFSRIDGGTEIRDRVLFRTPGGVLMDRLIAGPDLRRIFTCRERRALYLLRALQARDGAGPGASRIPSTNASSSTIERPI